MNKLIEMNANLIKYTFERQESKFLRANVIIRSYDDIKNSKSKKNQLRKFNVLLQSTILLIITTRTLCLLFIQNDFLGDLYSSFGNLMNSLFGFGSLLLLSIRLMINYYDFRNKSFFFWYLDNLLRDLKNFEGSPR